MPAIRFDLAVEMDGGESYVVTADQRDVSRFEMTDFYTIRKHTMMRYLAWAASVRQKLGVAPLSWEQFNETCVEVGEAPSEVEALDPGKPDPKTASS